MGAAQDAEIVQQEIFGPVLVVLPFDGDEEGLALANDTVFGLAASAWTRDVFRALRAQREIRAGCVWINDHIPIVSEMPHGGYKQSGAGKDMSQYSFDEYTQVKHVSHGHHRRPRKDWHRTIFGDRSTRRTQPHRRTDLHVIPYPESGSSRDHLRDAVRPQPSAPPPGGGARPASRWPPPPAVSGRPRRSGPVRLPRPRRRPRPSSERQGGELVQLAAVHRLPTTRPAPARPWRRSRSRPASRSTYTEDVNDNNEFYAKVRTQLDQGQDIGRDIVVLTDWMAALWIQNGYAQKLDKAVIPNWKNLIPALQNVAFDPDRDYSLPWQSGFGGARLEQRRAAADDGHGHARRPSTSCSTRG